MIPSVTCLRLNDAIIICRVTYFQFPIQSAFRPLLLKFSKFCSKSFAFLPCRKPGSRSGVRGLPNIGHRTLREMCEVRSLYAVYSPGERLWIDSNGKLETRHPADGYFGSEFLAIGSHCKVMVAWSCDTWKFCKQFCIFFEKRPLLLRFSKFCSKRFQHLTDKRLSVKISWNVADGKSTKSYVIHRTKKTTKFRLPLKLSRRRGSHPKSARASPKQCTHSAPHFIQIGSLSAEL